MRLNFDTSMQAHLAAKSVIMIAGGDALWRRRKVINDSFMPILLEISDVIIADYNAHTHYVKNNNIMLVWSERIFFSP